jgi:hypothetical protein
VAVFIYLLSGVQNGPTCGSDVAPNPLHCRKIQFMRLCLEYKRITAVDGDH